MPVGAVTPTQAWQPRDKDIKTYWHFDRRLSVEEITRIANDPQAVATNAFYPLLLYKEFWIKYRGKGRSAKKERPIRYAARRDAAIYARYRALLSPLYEDELSRLKLSDVPTAYRSLPIGIRSGSKSNIELARDAFDAVRRFGECTVTVLDISGFFESLDHGQIRSKWEQLIGSGLPPDHEAVYKSITKYSTVDLRQLEDRLRLNGRNTAGIDKKSRRMRLIDIIRSGGTLQICTPREFRERICGQDPNYSSLIQKNTKGYGIPQGTPISDLIANLYMIDIDDHIQRWIVAKGGVYRRYSDDLILIMPSSGSNFDEAKKYVQSIIEQYGFGLKIKDEKVAICSFGVTSEGLSFSHCLGKSSRHGLEYLGFRFDGRKVHIKNSTLSNAWRKLKRYSWGSATRFVKQYRLRKDPWLMQNYDLDNVVKRMLRDVSYSQDTGFESWTFIRYVTRASKAFHAYERTFLNQTRLYKQNCRAVAMDDLKMAISKMGYSAMISKNRRP